MAILDKLLRSILVAVESELMLDSAAKLVNAGEDAAKRDIRERKAGESYWGGLSGIGSFLERVVREDGDWEAAFLGLIRETFSRMSVICEWTAWRDCWSFRAISDGRWLFTR